MIHREYIWLHDVFSSTSRPQITASLSLQGWNTVTLNKKKKYLIIFHVTPLSDLFSAPFWCCRHESYKMSFVVLSLVYFLFSPIFCPPNTFTSQDLSVYLLRFFEHLINFFLTCYRYCFSQETVASRCSYRKELMGLLNDLVCFWGGTQCNRLFLQAFSFACIKSDWSRLNELTR